MSKSTGIFQKKLLIAPLLLITAILVGGCSTQPPPDPLAGWHFAGLSHLYSNTVIMDDCKTYMQTLSPEERKFAKPFLYYEDGTGQQAVRIEIGMNGTWWEHVLIYDKLNQRIKTIKYSSGGYRS